MGSCFENVKKNFGFGCMRLPMAGEEVDLEETCRMVDAFLEAGFHYFDTAHGYLGGKSEIALRHCLTSRYPRERYILTNKLSTHFIQKQEDIRPLFQQQLEACGVEYFDFYLMHAQDRTIFEKYKKIRAYETSLQLLAEGKIRHFGISFHDTAAVLEQILTEYPQIEVVQLQLNYVDFEDPSVQSRKCLEVCRKFGKSAIVMEPVKGGSLVKLPEQAQKIFDDLKGGSNASYAIRFAAGQEGVAMVLSGMSDTAMVRENCGYVKDFRPLNEAECRAVEQVCDIFRSLGAIPCTGCRYCTEVCPQGIAIPNIFSLLNAKRIWNSWNTNYYYDIISSGQGTRASDCLICGKCEDICPQHLKIRGLLEEAVGEFEAKKG